MVILEGINLTKKFGGLVAVNKLSFELNEKEILSIIGPNGAGKTTLLNLISGVHYPDEGKLIYRGEDITGYGPDLRCKLGIGRTFQILSPLPDLNVLENVMVGCLFGRQTKLSVPEAKKEAEKVLEFVELSEKAEYSIESLTTMELKKIELARALATEPEILLLDEIMTGLAVHELEEFLPLIKKIRDFGVSVILIEHVMKVVKRVSDRVIVMDQGAKIAEGNYEDVAKNPEVVKAYLGEAYESLA
jgi:branched-chain amino acid transport system ATP-binding protein